MTPIWINLKDLAQDRIGGSALSVIPAQAGIQPFLDWTPACAGVTTILYLICRESHWYFAADDNTALVR
jgi:hypothetical protein